MTKFPKCIRDKADKILQEQIDAEIKAMDIENHVKKRVSDEVLRLW
jgi:hypothetical protein